MIGVFDSGVGGLSVLTEIVALAPRADLTYVADRARAPYGPKTLGTVREMSHEIVDWLVNRSAETIVVACNTASAAALESLRIAHPGLAFVGMEPAVKPAAASTRSGVIGVLATEATFQGRLFRSLVSRYGGSAQVLTRACPHWVELVEAGQLSGPVVEQAVRDELESLLAQGSDLLVLGCTHFSFLKPVIQSVAGPDVRIVDPAPSVAAQTLRVTPHIDGAGRVLMAASGDIEEFSRLASAVAGVKATGPVLPFPS